MSDRYYPWSAEWHEETSDWVVVGSVSKPDADGIAHQPNVCTLSDWFSGDVARLIASAPELLEVVQAMARFDGRNNNSFLKEMAKAAIAKATEAAS